MALKPSGVRLIAENYSTYIGQMRNVNRAHKEAFGTSHLGSYKKGAREAAQSTNVFGQAMGFVLKHAKALAVGLVAIKLKKFAAESAMLAARNQTLGVVLHTVGETAGYSKEQIDWALESVKGMGITASSASQSLVRLAQANIDWSKASQLARIAQDAAVIGNINSSEAFSRMIHGLQTGNTLILRNIGISVNFQSAYKKMAQQLGKNATELNETEKAQARVNAVIEAGSRIAGAYGNAMGTVGKQMTSLPRLIEDAKVAWGDLFLPILQIRVEWQTRFWKAMKDVGVGMKSLGEITTAAKGGFDLLLESVAGVTNALLKIPKDETIWTRLSRSIHDVGGIAIGVLAYVTAFVGALVNEVRLLGLRIDATWKVIGSFGTDTAAVERLERINTLMKEQTFAEQVQSLRKEIGAAAREEFPLLLGSFDEMLEKTKEVSLVREDGSEELDKQLALLKKQGDQLVMQVSILKKLETIEGKYTEAIASAGKARDKALTDLLKSHSKRIADLNKKTTKALAGLDEDARKREQRTLQDFNRERLQDEKERNLRLEQERRRHLLSMQQELRRYQLDEKRLIAEGDVLGLMQLREEWELRKQEEKENRDETLRGEEEDWNLRRTQEEEDLALRLRRLKEDVEERRKEILQSYHEELNDLRDALAEQQAEIHAHYEERLAEAIAARDRELDELGAGLREAGEITRQGFNEIRDIVSELFGEDAADAMVAGWSNRFMTELGKAIEAAKNELRRLQIEMGELRGEAPVGGPSWARERRQRGQPMQHGGAGVVTGPASFDVEPGVQEAYAFIPLQKMKRTLDVRMSGGFDITGAEGASDGVVDAAVGEMVEMLRQAVNEVAIRGRGGG